jgi:hypothetical protein
MKHNHAAIITALLLAGGLAQAQPLRFSSI